MVNEALGLFFPDEVERIRQNKCPLCSKDIIVTSFTSELSLKEFHISGMCQECQDDIFNKGDDILNEGEIFIEGGEVYGYR